MKNSYVEQTQIHTRSVFHCPAPPTTYPCQTTPVSNAQSRCTLSAYTRPSVRHVIARIGVSSTLKCGQRSYDKNEYKEDGCDIHVCTGLVTATKPLLLTSLNSESSTDKKPERMPVHTTIMTELLEAHTKTRHTTTRIWARSLTQTKGCFALS